MEDVSDLTAQPHFVHLAKENSELAEALVGCVYRDEVDIPKAKILVLQLLMNGGDMVNCEKCGVPCPNEQLLELHRNTLCRADETLKEEEPDVPFVFERRSIVKEERPDGLWYANSDPNLRVQRAVWDALGSALRLAKKLGHANVLLRGEPGNGKTSLPIELGAHTKRPLAVVDMGQFQEPRELYTEVRLVRDGDHVITVERESLLIRAMLVPNSIIILDEVNRTENQKVLNALFPFLDQRRRAYVSELDKIIQVAEGVIFVATMNEGAGMSGTDSVDDAFRARFGGELGVSIKIPGPKAATMAQIISQKTGLPHSTALKVVRVVDGGASTRGMLGIALQMTMGAGLGSAIRRALDGMDEVELEKILAKAQSMDNSRIDTEECAWPFDGELEIQGS